MFFFQYTFKSLFTQGERDKVIRLTLWRQVHIGHPERTVPVHDFLANYGKAEYIRFLGPLGRGAVHPQQFWSRPQLG